MLQRLHRLFVALDVSQRHAHNCYYSPQINCFEYSTNCLACCPETILLTSEIASVELGLEPELKLAVSCQLNLCRLTPPKVQHRLLNSTSSAVTTVSDDAAANQNCALHQHMRQQGNSGRMFE